MKDKVFFTNFRATIKENLPQKIKRFLNEAELFSTLQEGDLSALKIHFGEKGNLAFLNPLWVKAIIEEVKSKKIFPFLTDSNTLYAGSRKNSLLHLKTAIENGFAYSVMANTPIIIADGLRGENEVEVDIGSDIFKKFHIAGEIANADSLLVVSHFKGHELAGFGGAIKNLAMGCASRRGKLAQHSTVSPKIKRKDCKACLKCLKKCPADAIEIVDNKAKINKERCIGCAECIVVCPEGAIRIQWDKNIPDFLKGLVEYAKASLFNKKDKVFFVNFISNVSPLCDCLSFNDTPIVRDIGILASKNPVAIDKASIDLVNKESVLKDSVLFKDGEDIKDKFKTLHPKVDWQIHFDYAKEINFFSSEYELVHIE